MELQALALVQYFHHQQRRTEQWIWEEVSPHRPRYWGVP
jgi:hypothetical protein